MPLPLRLKHASGVAAVRALLVPIVVAALLCSGFTVCCGMSHSVLSSTFGGVLIVTIALPPLVLAVKCRPHRLLVATVGVVAVIAVWLFLPIDWPQWWACAVLLAAYAAALTGMAALLRRVGANAVVSAAVVVVVALAWLSWPVWLSPCLAGHETLVDWLVFAHPLLALNGVLIDQGIWTERPLMYGWTALNQDVTYSMPSGVWSCVVLHCALGLAFSVSAAFRNKKKTNHESTRIDTN
jgi:hypothetical protein